MTAHSFSAAVAVIFIGLGIVNGRKALSGEARRGQFAITALMLLAAGIAFGVAAAV